MTDLHDTYEHMKLCQGEARRIADALFWPGASEGRDGGKPVVQKEAMRPRDASEEAATGPSREVPTVIGVPSLPPQAPTRRSGEGASRLAPAGSIPARSPVCFKCGETVRFTCHDSRCPHDEPPAAA